MVRALLAGTKTQTRRVAKLLGAEVIEERPDGLDGAVFSQPWPWSPQHDGWVSCPYGRPGDRLWVRETWTALQPTTDAATAAAHRDRVVERPEDGERVALWYRADGEMPLVERLWADEEDGIRWRPSIHMPRWASRIALEVTAVRVERLHDISEADARAEGISCTNSHRWGLPETGMEHNAPTHAFRTLWESINGADSWDVNPWVWVISFKRVTP